MKTHHILFLTLTLLINLNLIACSATPSRESTGEFLDSSLITAKVKTKLIDDRITGGFHISVSTFKGVVRLSGTVNSDFEKNHASKIAQGVDGVKEVNNMLVVRND